MILQRFDKTFTTLRVRITTIHETMNISLADSVFLGDIRQLQKMLQRAMYTTIGNQAHEVDLLIILFCVAISTFDLRVLHDRILTASDVDLHQILVNDTASTDVQVAHLRVTHLSVRQTNVLARSL